MPAGIYFGSPINLRSELALIMCTTTNQRIKLTQQLINYQLKFGRYKQYRENHPRHPEIGKQKQHVALCGTWEGQGECKVLPRGVGTVFREIVFFVYVC